MDEQEKPNSVFPAGYSYLEESLRLTQGKLQQIDQRIANLPQDQNHRLNFRPPGDYKVNDRGRQLSRKEQLESEKQQIKQEYKAEIYNRLKFADAEPTKKVREIVDYQLSDNEYKNKGREELGKNRTDQKTFSQSYDYMAAHHYAQFGKVGRPLQEHEAKIQQPKYNLDKMGERFLKQMSYPDKSEFKDDSLTRVEREEYVSYNSLIAAKEKEKPERDID